MLSGPTAFMAVLLVAALSAGQDINLSLVDTGPNERPVVLSGSVIPARTAVERPVYSYRIELSAKNESAKAILLMVTTVDVAAKSEEHQPSSVTRVPGGRKITRIDDYFFSPHVFRADASQSWEEFMPPFSPPDSDFGGALLEVTGHVAFVQFTDGSTWGETTVAEGALQQREALLGKLRFLTNTYKDPSVQDFATELMKPSSFPIITELQRRYQVTGDVRAIAEELARRLKYAALHQSAFNGHSGRNGG